METELMTQQGQPDICEALAARYGTPLYVYRASVIRRQALRLQKAFPDFALLYSMKCNPLPGICSLLADLGTGFDCCSGREVLAASETGLPCDRIFYSAPGKTRQEIISSLGKSIVFADSWSELELINSIGAERGIVIEAGLRVSPAISLGQGTKPAVHNAMPDKFGVPEEDLPARSEWLASLKNVRLTGLHVYMRSQVLDAGALSAVFAHTAAIARLLHACPGFTLRYVNFGGGFGIPCQGEEELPLEGVSRTCSALAKDLLKLCPGVRLFLESGRYLVGQAGSFISRILDVKECRGTTFAIAEGMLNHFFRPALARLLDDFANSMPAAPKGPCEPLWGGPGILLPSVHGTPAPARPVTLCGTLCTAQDCVAKDVVLPGIVPGNLLVFPNAGAYGSVLSPHDFGFQNECRQVLLADDNMEACVLNQLVLKDMQRHRLHYDQLVSEYDFQDFAFSKLRERYNAWTGSCLEETVFDSFAVREKHGKLTNAGALLADESPIRHSRLSCIRWNGLDKSGGIADALDSAEYSGSLIIQLCEGFSFVKRNMKTRWKKTASSRIVMPDYCERSVFEALVNALIHRDYRILDSGIHIDMYDDRLTVCSPGGMADGSRIQEQDLASIPSMRRNPVLADIFGQLGYMEPQGNGFKKITDAYHAAHNYRDELEPKFYSDANTFQVTLYNLNYGIEISTGKVAIGPDKVAIGPDNVAIAPDNVAIGANKVAIAPDEVAIAPSKVAIGPDKLAIGPDNVAIGAGKLAIGPDKVAIGPDNVAIGVAIDRLNASPAMISKAKALFANMGIDRVFGRSDIAAITNDSVTAAGNLITKLKSAGLIQPVRGFGKGKYTFRQPGE